MKCPECHAEILDGLEVCSRCNALIDPSSLEALEADSPFEEELDVELEPEPESAAGPGHAPERRRGGAEEVDPWKSVVLTSAKQTSEVEAEVAREAVARAIRRSRRSPSPDEATQPPDPVPAGATGPHRVVASSRRATSESRRAAELPGAAEPDDDAPDDAPRDRPFGAQADVATRIVTLDPEADRNTRIVDLNLPAVVKKVVKEREHEKEKVRVREPAKEGSGGADAPKRPAAFRGIAVEESRVSRGLDEMGESVRVFFSRMHRMDRRTSWALAVAFLGAFLPWSHVRGEGTLAGIQEYGSLAAVASGLAFVCIYLRTARRRLTALVLGGQVLLAAALVAIPIFRILTEGDLADLAYGVYITALGGAAVVLLTLARLARMRG
jgi:hypothetical protein